MTLISGIFLIRKDNKILLCHPTKHSPDFWSIPKGRVDKGEELIDTAIRETFEETNVDLKDLRVYHVLESVPYDNDKKTLHCFAVLEIQNTFDFDSFDIKCNSNVAPEKGGFPEMDDFRWATLEEAKPLMHMAQALALEQVDILMKKVNQRHGK